MYIPICNHLTRPRSFVFLNNSKSWPLIAVNPAVLPEDDNIKPKAITTTDKISKTITVQAILILYNRHMTISSKDYGTIIFFCCVGCYILFLLVKKTYLYFKYRRILFIFPKLNSKGIANISMVIAISIAIITLLIVLSSGIFGVLFRVYPS
jgi:hypothetical protein